MLSKQRDYFNRRAAEWSDDLSAAQAESLEEIMTVLSPETGEKILDLGCGAGILTERLTRGMTGEERKLVSVDLAEEMVKRVRRDYSRLSSAVCGAAEELPLAARSFDRIICFSVFPHFSSPRSVLEEINRLLVPGGRAVIAHVDSRQQLNQFHSNLKGVVSADILPPLEELQEIIQAAGLRVLQMDERENLYLAVFGK